MTGLFSSVCQGWAACFRSRRQLLIENWSLRHQLNAAQQDLLRAAARTRGSGRSFEAAGEESRIGRRDAWCGFPLLGQEEPRICLVLMLIASVLVVANTIRAVRTFAPAADTGNVWAELDSFSEPAVAQAVLRREGETMLIDYTDKYNEYLQQLDTWRRSYTAWLAAGGLSDTPANAKRYEGVLGKKPDFATDAWINRFQAMLFTIREQPTTQTLEHTLLLIYERNRLWPQFIDLYLDLVRRSSSEADIVSWAEPALRHAAESGRIEQVLASLRLATQCDPDHFLADLAPILKRWNETMRVSVPLVLSRSAAQPSTL